VAGSRHHDETLKMAQPHAGSEVAIYARRNSSAGIFHN
jgi:hypothetical protein